MYLRDSAFKYMLRSFYEGLHLDYFQKRYLIINIWKVNAVQSLTKEWGASRKIIADSANSVHSIIYLIRLHCVRKSTVIKCKFVNIYLIIYLSIVVFLLDSDCNPCSKQSIRKKRAIECTDSNEISSVPTSLSSTESTINETEISKDKAHLWR